MGLFDFLGAPKHTQLQVKELTRDFIIGVSENAGIDILECRAIALVKGFKSIDLGGKTQTRGNLSVTGREYLAVVDPTNLKEFSEFKKVWIEVASGAAVESGAAYTSVHKLVEAVGAEFAKQSPEYRQLKEL